MKTITRNNILAMLVGVLMVFTMIPITAVTVFAETGDSVGDVINVNGLTYLITSLDDSSGTVELTGYSTEPSGTLNIPQCIEHNNAVYNITSIGEDAFDFCTTITSVIIPDGVTIIKEFAFGQCWSITSVTIPETVVTIYDRAFLRCSKIKSISLPRTLKNIGASAFLGCNSLTEVSIHSGITSIGNQAFSECKSLVNINVSADNTRYSSQDGVLFDKTGKSLICYPAGKHGRYNVPDGVETIGKYAFYYSERLLGVYIPDTVKTIDSSAFSYCIRLSEVRLSTGIATIASYAFNNCSKLSDATYAGSSGQWNSISISQYGNTNLTENVSFECNNEPFEDSAIGEQFNYGGLDYLVLSEGEPYGTLELLGYDVEPSGELILPDTVTYKGKEYVIERIGDSAFGWCQGITKVVIPGSVKELEYFAFGQCWKLQDVQLSNGLKIIGKSAFVRDSKINSITIPESTVTIGESAFMGCDAISGITIPESVKTIDRDAFSECESLLRINVSDDNTSYSDMDGVLFNKDKTQLICYPGGRSGNYTVPDGVIEIGYNSFGYCTKLLNVVIPKSVNNIGNYAFYNCTGLNSVIIGKSVSSIGNYAFSGCKYLSSARFLGTEDSWSSVSIGSSNSSLTDVLEFGCNHKFSDGVITKQATCTETGEEISYCSICGDSKIELLPLHSQTIVVDEGVAPTCIEDGLTEGSHCSACNEVIVAQETISALGHSYSEEWAVDKEPGCTTEGSKSRHCTRCEDVTDITTISALGHDWDDGEITTEPTCTDEGEVTFSCSRCKETRTEAVEAIGHAFAEEYTVDVDPTCTSDGTKSRHCTRCEERKDVTPIAATGHTFGDWTEIAPSTCEGAGVHQHSCTVCGFTESEATDPKGHDVEGHFTIDVPATCTTDGSQSKHCRNCEITFYSEVIPATGHSYGEWITTYEPTCEENGSREKICAGCGDKITEEISALDHDWSEATCTEPKTCKRCHKAEGAALGHKLTKTVPKAATTTAEGNIEYWMCETCGKLFKDSAGKTEITKADTVVPKKSEEASEPGSNPKQMGSDGTAVGPGASAAAADKAVTTMKTDSDPAGSVFASLTVNSPKQTSSSITLKWSKIKSAKKYIIYANKCGKTAKPKRVATVTGTTKTFKKVAGKKLKKGVYYKFIIVAIDKNNNVISTSKVIHVATKGSKVGNHKSVIVSKTVIAKARKLSKGKTLKLNAKAVAQSTKLKVKQHVSLRYESTNKKIATVNKSGKVTAKKKGICYIYAFAQDGVFKKIKVIVK